MRTKIVFFAGAAAFALLTAGCGDKTTPAAAPSAPAPATTTAAAPAPAESASVPAAAPTTSKPAVTPVKTTKPKPTSDAGDGGNWLAALKPCPNKGQEVDIEKMATGDVTGDGLNDVIIARSCTAITSYWPSTVEIFDGAAGGEKPKRIGTLLGDLGATDGPAVQTVKVDGRVLTITAYGLSPKAAVGCPDLKLTYQYKYSGGGFTRTSRKAVTSADCLPIQ
ncbi:hypothetical protein [Actinoplanes sp. NPDC020271]|uniref:hypothetical protein n=1 Tax=Actinoplanes sp. NPDC020271 TaxID=3363896 RepID=UPI003787717A